MSIWILGICMISVMGYSLEFGVFDEVVMGFGFCDFVLFEYVVLR